MTLEFLLRSYLRTDNKEALEIVSHTARKMANGGMYDQLGGGFHRYSTDAEWLVPHFEKMLYDNALLSRLYLHHYQLTQDELSKQTVTGILDYVLREMTDVSGGFYSTQDADSEGHEGKFFVWSMDEIRNALEPHDAELFSTFYNITQGGNFEGKNIPNVTRSLEEVAKDLGISPTELRESIERSRRKLFELREQRVKPDRDEKILTAWNGLMLASFAEAGAVLNRSDYVDAARNAAEFILTNLRKDGFLLRTYKDGVAKFNAYLEDYAFLSEGLLTLYETTGEGRWLEESVKLAEQMIREFWDEENGGFYFTGKSHEDLIVRSKDYFDNATPSGNSVAAIVLLRLALLLNNDNYRNRAIVLLSQVAETAKRFPSGFGYALSAADFHLSTPKEVAIVGSDKESLKTFMEAVWSSYRPNKVVAASMVEDATGASSISLLENRTAINGQTTAYVCENYTCQQPVTSVADLRSQLDSAVSL
jgi:uncharacterized protein YyaL (SSP411 family)